jgi:hypothetical protein
MRSRGLLPATKRAGLRHFTYYDLRHTFGSHLIAAGVDLKTVSTLMGHSSIAVTLDIYGHMLRGKDREAIDRLAAALGSKTVAAIDFDRDESLQEIVQPIVSMGGSGWTRTNDQGIMSPLL